MFLLNGFQMFIISCMVLIGLVRWFHDSTGKGFSSRWAWWHGMFAAMFLGTLIPVHWFKIF